MELNSPVPSAWLEFDLNAGLGVATLLGLLLELDWEMSGQAARLRTHGIICLASATVTETVTETVTVTVTVPIIGPYLQLNGTRKDPLHIFEAPSALIGFIGAGLIVFGKGRIKNLATAVHLWLTAVICIACGAALWPLVVASALILVIMLTLLGLVERRILTESDGSFE